MCGLKIEWAWRMCWICLCSCLWHGLSIENTWLNRLAWCRRGVTFWRLKTSRLSSPSKLSKIIWSLGIYKIIKSIVWLRIKVNQSFLRLLFILLVLLLWLLSLLFRFWIFLFTLFLLLLGFFLFFAPSTFRKHLHWIFSTRINPL